MKNKSLFVMVGVFLIFLFNSVIYGALNTDMFIDGDAYVRVDKNIRVTGIKVLEQVGEAYETYNCDYSKDTTSIQVTLPSSDSSIVYEITITNKGDIDYEVTNIAEDSYSNNNIKYEIIDLEKGTVIDGETTHTFKIKLTTTENDSENKGTLVLKYTFEEWIPSLYKMVAHKSRSLDTNLDFGVAPTKETSGVYKMNSTKDDEYPVYYYRGIVENNNVSFAGFCWKVVRTTSTGGVKLIYNGVPASDDGSCDNTGVASSIGTSVFNTSYTSVDDVSYVYNNGTDSTIKVAIDEWYSDNMVEYTDMLEDTPWCSDKSIYKTSGSYVYFGAYKRSVEMNAPSIYCLDDDNFTVNSKNGNGKLVYPVALLTIDEALLAGYKYNTVVGSMYLTSGQNFCLFSPYALINDYYASAFMGSNYSSDIFYLGDFGKITAITVAYSKNGVRPVISLCSMTNVIRGDGTFQKPYVIKEK